MIDQVEATGEWTGVRDVTRKAAQVEVDLVDDDTLLTSTLAASEARAALDAAEGHLLAELERRQTCDRELGLSTVSWLADRTHGARGPITGRVKTATRLRVALGEVDQALADGRITSDHARVLADAVANPRIADQIADLQHDLIELAGEGPFRVWRAHVARLVELLDQDSGFDPNADLHRNKLRVTPLGADHVKIEGELVGETAAVVAQALNEQADRVYRRYVSDHTEGADDIDVPSRATCLALALADLCREARATDPTTSHAPHPDITIVVHTDPPDSPGDESEIEWPMRLTTTDGLALHLARYEHLLCDAEFHALLIDSLGVPLDLGHTVRLANRAQRRAIAQRDGGCVFPGCDQPISRCDIHHIILFDHDGPTDLANLAPLCRHHHGVSHRRGWTMVTHPDQTFTWTTPTGRTLHSQRHHRPPGRRPS